MDFRLICLNIGLKQLYEELFMQEKWFIEFEKHGVILLADDDVM